MYVSSCESWAPRKKEANHTVRSALTLGFILTVGHERIRHNVRPSDIPGQTVRVDAALQPVRRQQDDALLGLLGHRRFGLLRRCVHRL